MWIDTLKEVCRSQINFVCEGMNQTLKPSFKFK